MTNTTKATSLIASETTSDEYSEPLQRALGSLMLNIRANLPMEIVRIKHSESHKDHSYERAAYVALKWTDLTGQPRSVVHVDTTGQYWAENPPQDAPGINDCYSTFDKIIDAVNYQYDIKTFVDEQGNAILTWNRASHGNCPAIVLTPEDDVLTYYHAPHQITAILDQTSKPRYNTPRDS